MLISPWVKRVEKILTASAGRKPRRRKQPCDWGRSFQIEQCEARTMLSGSPVITLVPPGPVTVTEHSGPVVLAPSSTVTDTVANFSGGTLTESITANASPGDQLAIQNQGTGAGQIGVVGSNVQFEGVTIGTFTGGNGATPLVVTLNANATPTAVQALQENITFQTTSDVPGARTFQSVVSDSTDTSAGVSAPVTETINVVEAKPVISLNVSNLTVSNSAPVVIAPNATITSTETHNLNGGTLTVSLTNGTALDQLAIQSRHGSSIRILGKKVIDNGVTIGTVTGGNGTKPLVITFNSNATFASAQDVARSVTFRSIGHFAHQPTVNFQLNDGDGGISDMASVMLNVIHGHGRHGDNDNDGDSDADDGVTTTGNQVKTAVANSARR